MWYSALVALCASLAGLGGLDAPRALDHGLNIHPSEIAHDPSLFLGYQRDALAVVNRYRSVLDLPPMRLDPILCRAAQAHSRYLATNRRFGHDEQPGMPGYTGGMPWDRAHSAGYPNNCVEDVSSNTDPAGAIHQLMAAPYHRFPFLEPAPIALGVGRGETSTTLEFDAKPGAAGVIVYPFDGQGGVPTMWRGREMPDPLRMHRARAPVGYVISYNAFVTEGTKVSFGAAKLIGEDGREVACYRNTPDNDDHLTNALLLIPMSPLRPAMRYRVSVDATAGEGLDISRVWSFVTAGVTGAPDLAFTVKGAPGGLGALLTVRITNRGSRSSGALRIAVGSSGRREVQAPLPPISPGEVVEVEISVKAPVGQVRLLAVQKSGKPVSVGATAKYDVRSAARR